jgi:hypothetical protein
MAERTQNGTSLMSKLQICSCTSCSLCLQVTQNTIKLPTKIRFANQSTGSLSHSNRRTVDGNSIQMPFIPREAAYQ